MISNHSLGNRHWLLMHYCEWRTVTISHIPHTLISTCFNLFKKLMVRVTFFSDSDWKYWWRSAPIFINAISAQNWQRLVNYCYSHSVRLNRTLIRLLVCWELGWGFSLMPGFNHAMDTSEFIEIAIILLH